jgi:hypothetical protein
MRVNQYLLVDFLYHAFRMIVRGSSFADVCPGLLVKYFRAHHDLQTRFGVDVCVDMPDLLHAYIFSFLNGQRSFRDVLCFEYALWEIVPLVEDICLGPRYLRTLEFVALNGGRQRTIEQLYQLVMAQSFAIVSPLDGSQLFP